MNIRVPLSSPDIDEDDIEAVVSVLRSSRLSLGPKLIEFEAAMARYIGVEHAVAVSSGTAGLDLVLKAVGIGENDEVLVPSFAFIAAANAILYQRARPVFVDIAPGTFNMDPAAVRAAVTPRTRAIMVVHTFGYPADLEPLLAIAREFGLTVVEDACEAISAEYRGQRVGSFGAAAVFSFYPNKPMTTGEGGVIVTRDPALAEQLRALRNQGRLRHDGWLDHSVLGYNCRLSDLNCALGITQLQRLDSMLELRAGVASRYHQLLATQPGLSLPPLQIANGKPCHFVFPVSIAQGRDQVMAHLQGAGIECRAYFPPIHKQPLYRSYVTASLPNTELLSSQMLALPFFNHISDQQLSLVCDELAAAIDKAGGPRQPTS